MNIKFEPVAWIGRDDKGEHRSLIAAYSEWAEFEVSICDNVDGRDIKLPNGDSPYFPTLEAAQAAAVAWLATLNRLAELNQKTIVEMLAEHDRQLLETAHQIADEHERKTK